MAENTKNPLSAALGAFMQNERKKKVGLSIEDLSERLKISPSLYKMVESGNAAINSNKAFEMIAVFNDANILFDRLAKYMVSQGYVDNLISKGSSPQEALISLAENDEEFRKFFQNIEGYFKYPDGSKEQKEYIQKTVLKELVEFLSNKIYPAVAIVPIGTRLEDKLNQMPSLNTDVLEDFINSFARIMPQHLGHIAAEWENLNKLNFKSVEGLFLNTKHMISEDNLNTYYYPYLDSNNFESLNFIFLSKDGTEKKLQEDFKRILNSCRADNKRTKVSENDLEKIHFKTITHESVEKSEEIKKLLKDPYQFNTELQAFWVFTTISGNKIGFVGVNEGGDVNKVYNLSYGETQDRSQIWLDLWKPTKPNTL